MKDKWIVIGQIGDEVRGIIGSTLEKLKKQNFFQRLIVVMVLGGVSVLGVVKTDAILDLLTIIAYTIITFFILRLLERVFKSVKIKILIVDTIGWIVVFIYSKAVSRRMLISVTLLIFAIYTVTKIFTLIKPIEEFKKRTFVRIMANILGVAAVSCILVVFSIPFKGISKPEDFARNYFMKKGESRKNIHIIESRDSYEIKGIDVVVDIGDVSLLKGRKATDSSGKKLPYILKEYVVWYNESKILEVTELDKMPELERKNLEK